MHVIHHVQQYIYNMYSKTTAWLYTGSEIEDSDSVFRWRTVPTVNRLLSTVALNYGASRIHGATRLTVSKCGGNAECCGTVRSRSRAPGGPASIHFVRRLLAISHPAEQVGHQVWGKSNVCMHLLCGSAAISNLWKRTRAISLRQ